MAHTKPQPVTEHSKEVAAQRISPNQQQKRLVAHYVPDGFHACFVNDEDNGQNIKNYLRAGYTFPMDTKINGKSIHESHSGIENVQQYVGGGITAHLMLIPEELYQQDVAAPALKSHNLVKSISRRTPQGNGEISFYNKTR